MLQYLSNFGCVFVFVNFITTSSLGSLYICSLCSRAHSKLLTTKVDLNEQEERDEAMGGDIGMEDVGKEDVIEEQAAKKQRLITEDVAMEEVQQQDQVKPKEEPQHYLEQEMEEGEEEEELEDGDEEEEEEEEEELTKDRCGRPRPFALTHSSHAVKYPPPSSLK